MEYAVRFEIEVDGDTPEDAARVALALLSEMEPPVHAEVRPIAPVGEVWEKEWGPVVVTNARLIAAAPDLLVACKAAEHFGVGGRALDLVRAAIAKAEGK